MICSKRWANINRSFFFYFVVKYSIPKEWFEILSKLSKDKRISLSQLLIEIYKSNECLNLPYVEPTSYKSINIQCECSDLIKHLKFYLFCLDE